MSTEGPILNCSGLGRNAFPFGIAKVEIFADIAKLLEFFYANAP